MKKVIVLTGALLTATVAIPTALGETPITATAATYTPMQLMEVKEGQFDENGFAYFALTIPQEGFYRLVGDNTKTYKTAVTTDEDKLETAPLQAASKLRVLKTGTYYVKIKGTPNATYHFKFAERTFDMEQEWPHSNTSKKYLDFPYYTERKVTARLNITDDKYLRLSSQTEEHSEAVEAINLKNIDTGETYTAKKISNYTFSSNAPTGTYEVSLVLTDAFKNNPYPGKMRLKYTLGEHLPLNGSASSSTTAADTFTLNLTKDTKIRFILRDTKGRLDVKRPFSIYDDKHQLVKRVHILPGKTSRSFTYTVKKGRYSVTAPDMVIDPIVKRAYPPIDDNTTFENLSLLEVKDGQFDENGYAYFKVSLDQPAGNYQFVGNTAVRVYPVWMAPSADQFLTISPMSAGIVRYIEKGTYYVAIEGKPHANYHFKLKRRTYNVETMNTLKPAKDDYDKTNVAKIPIYNKNQPTVKFTLSKDQYVQFFTLASKSNNWVEKIVLTNNETNKKYTPYKLSGNRFDATLPKGTYTLALKAAQKANGQHIAVRYFLPPALPLNRTVKYTEAIQDRYTLNVSKDTKIKFKITDSFGIQGSMYAFNLYNEKNEVVKRVKLKDDQVSREFVYTVKKGHYHIKAKYLDITTTVLN